MKSKFFFFILLSLLTFTAFAQQKKVAVYVTGEQSGVTKVLGDQLVAAFSKSNDYKAIERTSSFLAEISKEQGYQRTGAVDDKEISRLGKQFGVQYVCVADISEAFGKKYVSARLINVENAEIVSSANEYSDLNSMEELIRVSDVLKSQLLNLKLNVRRNTARVAEGYTDLGLPSGTMWRDYDAGGLYSYSEAINKFGDRLPSKEQLEELINECQWVKINNGYKVTGPNGNSITLQSAWPRSNCPDGSWGIGFPGYWSKTIKDERYDEPWLLFFWANEGPKMYGSLPCCGYSVRLVQN